MRLVKSLHTIYCAVRANLLGGWTDQLLWDEAAAVVNFSMGWASPKCHRGGYPLMLYKDGRFVSVVKGRGTGLGISSIRAAMMHRQAFPHSTQGYIRFVLEYEKAILGTEGGWQDQIGGLHPGFKLIITPNYPLSRHQEFEIERRDDHPVLERIVLFDTGVRRNAGDIGDAVRHLMVANEDFRDHLRKVAQMAVTIFHNSAEETITACNFSWEGFVNFVPAMTLPRPLPKTEMIVGQMLLGAGGGGFGLVFTRDAGFRPEVIRLLQSAGFWATKPQLMIPGILLIDD